MITEAFGEKSTEDFSDVTFVWMYSEKTSNKIYYVDSSTGKIHGHVIMEYDVWNANFNFTNLGRFITMQYAKDAVVNAAKK